MCPHWRAARLVRPRSEPALRPTRVSAGEDGRGKREPDVARPPSAIRRPSPVARRLSSFYPRRSSIIVRPSSLFPCPSSLFPCPSSRCSPLILDICVLSIVVHCLSLVAHHASLVAHHAQLIARDLGLSLVRDLACSPLPLPTCGPILSLPLPHSHSHAHQPSASPVDGCVAQKYSTARRYVLLVFCLA